ncbi:MAG: bifunctional glutamate N-acetyltransferase/amino-acid acetyltransferase ArgJ [Candidatus Eisenbacteria bacterium]
MNELRPIPGGILCVPGFRVGSARCGFYDGARDDVGVLVADRDCTVAGVFTRNSFPAAPVLVTRGRIRRHPYARSLVINAGNANALTGEAGAAHARRMVEKLEGASAGPGLVLSTGVIGVPLPIDDVVTGIKRAVSRLSDESDAPFASAILTTDTGPKTASVEVLIPDSEESIRVGGVAKGSGMIHPNMATMLAVLTVDDEVAPDLLDHLLRAAVDGSFHRISVDGDTSTNDAVLVFARPRDGSIRRCSEDARLAAIAAGLDAVSARLAEKIVGDGEGMSMVLRVEVTEASSEEAALEIARSIAGSLLVKTAVAGRDPNWGRIIAAAGNAGVPLDPTTITLTIGGVTVYDNGSPTPITEDERGSVFATSEVTARIELGAGEASATMRTTDLTHEYVTINAEYTT